MGKDREGGRGESYTLFGTGHNRKAENRDKRLRNGGAKFARYEVSIGDYK